MNEVEKGYKALAAAVIVQAQEDYQLGGRRQEVQAFLFSKRFILFTDLAGWNSAIVRRIIMGKDCSTCQNRYKEHLCVQCYETDPTKDHNYYKKDDRKKKKGLRK